MVVTAAKKNIPNDPAWSCGRNITAGITAGIKAASHSAAEPPLAPLQTTRNRIIRRTAQSSFPSFSDKSVPDV
jgi:hypothetical protein